MTVSQDNHFSRLLSELFKNLSKSLELMVGHHSEMKRSFGIESDVSKTESV